MADEAIVDDTTIVDTKADETIVADTTDYKALYEAEQASKEKLKLDIAGLDRKVGDLTKAEKERLIASETAQETAKREAEENRTALETRRNELTKGEAEVIAGKQALEVSRTAYDLKVDPEVIKKLGFTTVEQVTAYSEILNASNTEAGQEANKALIKGVSGINQQDYNNKNEIKVDTSFANRCKA